jgi:dihydrofolate reductase
MRRLRYAVAMSLDGFIAGPNGEHDWIVPDPSIDFAGIFAQYDTCVMGRGTWEIAKTRRALLSGSGQRWIVVSTTLKPEDCRGVTLLSTGAAETIAALKAQPGKDIWLFGGGILFRSLLDAGLVDTVEATVLPVLLGSGVPLLSPGCRRALHLTESKTLSSGILMLKYAVNPEPEVA